MKNVSSKIVVGDVLLYGNTAEPVLDFFITFLYLLNHHHATLKLKKCKCFQYMCEFVGMYMSAGETQPANTKKEVFSS